MQLSNDLLRNGRNTKNVESKTTIALLRPDIFIKKLWKYFSKVVKTEVRTH